MIDTRRAIVIGVFSLFCVIYGSLRFFLAGDAWGFLHYNLWLAWIPFLLVLVSAWRWTPKWLLPIIWLAWILFLPNAPYLVTDLIHLSSSKSTLPWFDLVLIFHFAVAGLLAGSLAVESMSSLVRSWIGRSWAVANSWVAILLSGLGVVIGREMRINSKDIYLNPFNVISEIMDSISSEQCLKALIYSGMFGVFYVVYRELGRGASLGP